MYRSNVQVTVYGWQNVPDRGVVRSCDPLKIFGGASHITWTAEPKVVYVNSSKTYHQQKERGYGHVTVLKFFRLSRRSGLSAATC